MSSAFQRPRIALLATGGTIAGGPSADGQTRYTAGALRIEDLLSAVPGLDALAELSAVQIASVGSQNMTHDVWLALAQRIVELQASADIDGIVVTHGTDTLEETAYFLSLVVPSTKPLVLVGAMRPAHAPSADGPANLLRAVALAADPQSAGRGPLVLMNEAIHQAKEVQKIRASGIEAFASPNGGPVGYIQGQTPVFLQAKPSAAAQPCFDIDQIALQPWPEVAIIFAHANAHERIIDDTAKWARGIVLAGVGEGNTTDRAWQALVTATKAGVLVVRATRCSAGAVVENGEVDDRQLGTIAAGFLSPQKARILLMLALLTTQDQIQIRHFFDLNQK